MTEVRGEEQVKAEVPPPVAKVRGNRTGLNHSLILIPCICGDAGDVTFSLFPGDITFSLFPGEGSQDLVLRRARSDLHPWPWNGLAINRSKLVVWPVASFPPISP